MLIGNAGSHVGQKFVHHEEIAIACDMYSVIPANGGHATIGHAFLMQVTSFPVAQSIARADVASLVELAELSHEFLQLSKLRIQRFFIHCRRADKNELCFVFFTKRMNLQKFLSVCLLPWVPTHMTTI